MHHDQSYGIIPFYLNPSDSVAEFLTIQNKIGGHWDFPKGHPEDGETPQEAALREFGEETGITSCKLIANLRYETSYTFKGNEGMISKNVDFFLAQVFNPALNLQEAEVKDAKWLKFVDCYQHLTFPSARKILEQANQDLAQLPPELLEVS